MPRKGQCIRIIPSVTIFTFLLSLSEELYSSDSHFVLELVQNADDNLYGPDVTPSLEMTLDLNSNTLVVACNETGFNKSQVKAICKIGASTKKYQEGYIGTSNISGNKNIDSQFCPRRKGYR